MTTTPAGPQVPDTVKHKTVSFSIGDAFSRTDEVGLWICSLAMLFNDVTLSSLCWERRQGGMVGRNFFFRLICAYIYEGHALLRLGRDDPRMATFVGTLPQEAQDALARILGEYEADGGTFLSAVLEPIRNRTFHYANLAVASGRNQLATAVFRARDVRTRLLVRGKVRHHRAAFADHVSLYWTFELPSKPTKQEKRLGQLDPIWRIISEYQTFLRYALGDHLYSKGVR